MNKKVEEAKKKVLLYEKKLKLAREMVIEAIRLTHIKCKACGKKLRLNTLVVYEAMWYTSPYGCTEGDYWNHSDERWIRCPHCDKVNRFFDKPKDSEQMELLQEKYVAKYVIVHGDKQLHEKLNFDRWVQ